MSLGAIGLLTQDVDSGGTTLVDDCNAFHEMICLAMLYMVHHRWPEGVRFVYNCYRH